MKAMKVGWSDKPDLAQRRGNLEEILTRVAFFQAGQHGIVDRFDRAGDEQAAGLLQRRKQLAMLLEMFDLDGRVVGDVGEFGVERFHDAHGVRGAVEEIGIAEGDVARARGDLLPDILEHHLALHHAKLSLVHRDHGTVPAQMLAAAAGLGVPGDCFRSVLPEMRIQRPGPAGRGDPASET